MKICMFVRNDMTTDSRVRKEAQVLAQMGHQVIVFALPGKASLMTEKVDGYEIRRIASSYIQFLKRLRAIVVKLHQLLVSKDQASDPRKQRAAPSDSQLRQREEVQRNWLFRPGLWLLDPHYCKRTIAEAIAERADVYHAHDLTTLHMAHRAAQATNAKLVYDSHELYLDRNPHYSDFNPISNFRLRRRERRLIGKADAVITVNESIAAELAGKYSIKKPHVIMNIPASQRSLDPTLLRKRLFDELGLRIRPDQKILLYIGTLAKHHGLEQVVESLRHLPDALFVMMGYGHHGNYLSKLIAGVKQSDLAERVFVLPPVPSDEVSKYASGADVGLVPIQNICRSYYLCSPNKIFECIAAHVPVAASDFPELKRIVTEHDVGEVFDETDPADIARAVRQILENPARYAELKRNTEKASQVLIWENEAAKLRQVYQSLERRPLATSNR